MPSIAWTVFFYIQYSFFFFPVQLTGVLLLLILTLALSSKEGSKRVGVVAVVLGSVFLFVYFYYGTAVLTSNWYKFYVFLRSNVLILNWDFYMFLFFFLGWAFKVGKKYTYESFTKGESFLYRSLLPSLIFFEGFTFVYLIVWRYLNTTMLGQATIMILKSYKFQYVVAAFMPKVFFFLASLLALQVLILELKRGNFLIFLFKYFLFVLVISYFLFLEFREF